VFIHRPVLATVVSVVIVVAGLQAVRSITVRQYPETETAAITVTTAYVGASADLVRGFITTPLERAIAGADGIEYVESQSAQGLSTIKVQLELNHDATRALAEVSSKVDRVRGELPPEAEVPVIDIVSAETEFASAYLGFSSEFLEQNEITDYLVRSIQPRLSAIDGVQRAEILGGRTFALRAWLKADRMAAFGVSPDEVKSALAANNYLAQVGRTKGSLIQVNLTANTDLQSVAEFEQLVVRAEGGTVVRLRDVADVALGAETYDEEVRFSGETAVFMGIWTLPNANALDVMERVRTEMKDIDRQLPEQIDAVIAYDATGYIESALEDVVRTLSETLAIVVIVIFLFLGSLRSVLVPVVAIPVSLIGAIFLMQAFGFTLNLLTLLAIVLSVGLVVDDAIVVVENVERRLRAGESAKDAALHGTRELAGPIIAMTLALAAVYAPVGLQGGLTGALFREFAFTLAGAVLISGVVALTLSPVMSARLLRREQSDRGFSARVHRGFERIKAGYTRLLDATLRARPAVYAVWVLLGLIAFVLFSQSPRELAPAEDQGVIFSVVNAPANATLDQILPHTEAANRVLLDTDGAKFTFQLTTPAGGFAGVGLRPWDERERTVFEILPEVRQKLQQIPGVQMFALIPPALPGGGQFPVELVIAASAEPREILRYAEQLQQRAATSGLFAFPPQIDVKIDQPQAELVFDRDKVAALGLSMQQVGSDLAAAASGDYVNRFNIAGRSYKVIPQLKRAERLDPQQIRDDLYVRGPGDQLIPLASIASLERSVQPRSLNRFQQLNAVKISGVSSRSLDDALTYLERNAQQILPRGYVVDYTGESRQLRSEGNRFLPAFGLAVVLIFLVLAAQFNSFRDPFVILAGSVPLAMFGALIVTFLKMPNPELPFWTDGWTTTLNVYSQIGLVTLVGLVAKNGILIVEFANVLQRQGHSKLEAVREAARTRLRPILMTTAATICGHLPLTLVAGPGALARNSIGLVLVTGMAVGTLFTLFVVPSLYVLIARDHRKEREASRPAREPLPQAAPA
jgi:multidrug efflux pump